MLTLLLQCPGPAVAPSHRPRLHRSRQSPLLPPRALSHIPARARSDRDVSEGDIGCEHAATRESEHRQTLFAVMFGQGE
eukprot:1287010-Rhodomonas_salina.1